MRMAVNFSLSQKRLFFHNITSDTTARPAASTLIAVPNAGVLMIEPSIPG